MWSSQQITQGLLKTSSLAVAHAISNANDITVHLRAFLHPLILRCSDAQSKSASEIRSQEVGWFVFPVCLGLVYTESFVILR
jgi:hypothetical protein